jgi:hypothetical protein
MAHAFGTAMAKLATNGQNAGSLIDCSDVIPIPPTGNGKAALPAGKSLMDLDQTVSNWYGCKFQKPIQNLHCSAQNTDVRHGSGFHEITVTQENLERT